MDKPLKKYPIVGACGLSCGLCPRYFTIGASRCPGCCGPGFWEKHPACGFITCCVKQKGLETCAECGDFEGCERVARLTTQARLRDSFISYQPLEANMCFIRERGAAELAREIARKQTLLKHLLEHCDEGRSKGFYCTSVQLLPWDSLKATVSAAEAGITRDASLIEKSRIVRDELSRLAESLGIGLELRKG